MVCEKCEKKGKLGKVCPQKIICIKMSVFLSVKFLYSRLLLPILGKLELGIIRKEAAAKSTRTNYSLPRRTASTLTKKTPSSKSAAFAKQKSTKSGTTTAGSVPTKMASVPCAVLSQP